MGDPKRWRDASAVERLLVASAEDDAPSAEAKRRALVALGLPPLTPSHAPPNASWLPWKWAAGGAGLALAVLPLLASLMHASDPPRAPRVEMPAPETSLAPSATTLAPIASVMSPVVALPSPTPTQHVVRRTPAPPPDAVRDAPMASSSPSTIEPPALSLRTETTMLETARRALALHDTHGAGRSLDDYDARFPHGVLHPEATVLRIQLLLATRERAAAESLAARFIDSDPTGPYAHRVRDLLHE